MMMGLYESILLSLTTNHINNYDQNCVKLVVVLGIFSRGVIKKLKFNKNFNLKKKTWIYWVIENKNTQIHKILQFPSTSFHVLKLSHYSLLLVFIIYCQYKYDHFILLNLYNIFVFMQLWLYICHFFFINILN